MKEKYKILNFPLAASYGGVTHYVINLWKNFDREKYQFDFLTFDKKLDFEKELLEEGCNVYHFSTRPNNDIDTFRMELIEILKNGYDLVVLHTSYWKDTIMEEIITENCDSKIIIHAHSADVTPYPLEKGNYEALYNRHIEVRNNLKNDMADGFCACSSSAANWLFGEAIKKKKINIIPNAIDLSEFSFDEKVRNHTREELGIKDKIVLGQVGRMEYEKRFDFSIDILKRLDSRYCLLLVGDGNERNNLIKKVNEYGLNERVFFVGKTSQVIDYYNAMDVLLIPSIKEGFCLSLVEGQAMGLPCVASLGIPEEAFVLEDTYRVSLEDIEQWVTVISNIFVTKERGIYNRIMHDKGCDILDHVQVIEKYYERVINNEK